MHFNRIWACTQFVNILTRILLIRRNIRLLRKSQNHRSLLFGHVRYYSLMRSWCGRVDDAERTGAVNGRIFYLLLFSSVHFAITFIIIITNCVSLRSWNDESDEKAPWRFTGTGNRLGSWRNSVHETVLLGEPFLDRVSACGVICCEWIGCR